MPLPNFLFIGTGKAGSTSLHYYLKQHPQIFISPVKETNFFAFEGEKLDFSGPGDQESETVRNSITNIETYLQNFDGVSDELAIGEICPSYLYVEKSPERIKHYIPDAKMIAILRNPVDRAYSNFSGLVKTGRETLSDFSEAVHDEQFRVEKNWAPGWHHVSHGFYYQQLKRYFDLFDRDQFRIYLFEDWTSDPFSLVKDIFEFIGVDSSFEPDLSTVYNKSGKPRSRVLYKLLSQPNPIKDSLKPLLPRRLRSKFYSDLQNFNLQKLPEMSPELRKNMVNIYKDDVLNLQGLIGKDLSQWLKF